MTFSPKEFREWAQAIAATYVDAPAWCPLARQLLLVGYLKGLQEACDASRHKGDRKRIDNLIKDAKKGQAA